MFDHYALDPFENHEKSIIYLLFLIYEVNLLLEVINNLLLLHFAGSFNMTHVDLAKFEFKKKTKKLEKI